MSRGGNDAPGTDLGEVSARAAEHTGIPAGTRIRAGMTDSCAAQEDLAGLYAESFEHYLAGVDSARGLWGRPGS